jgi:hypothetical protein
MRSILNRTNNSKTGESTQTPVSYGPGEAEAHRSVIPPESQDTPFRRNNTLGSQTRIQNAPYGDGVWDIGENRACMLSGRHSGGHSLGERQTATFQG